MFQGSSDFIIFHLITTFHARMCIMMVTTTYYVLATALKDYFLPLLIQHAVLTFQCCGLERYNSEEELISSPYSSKV